MTGTTYPASGIFDQHPALMRHQWAPSPPPGHQSGAFTEAPELHIEYATHTAIECIGKTSSRESAPRQNPNFLANRAKIWDSSAVTTILHSAPAPFPESFIWNHSRQLPRGASSNKSALQLASRDSAATSNCPAANYPSNFIEW
jgi:hypothetical protein